MTKSEFITYCRALLDAEYERLRIEDLKDGADRELAGTLKLISNALANIVDDQIVNIPGPPPYQSPYYFKMENPLSPPWTVTSTTRGTSDKETNTKQQLND